MIVLLWHYKQKEKPKAWATFLQVLAISFVGGVMIAIILAIVKTKDAVRFLHNIEKSLKSESSLRTNVVKEVKATNIKITKQTQQMKSVLAHWMLHQGRLALPRHQMVTCQLFDQKTLMGPKYLHGLYLQIQMDNPWATLFLGRQQ